MGDTPFPSSPDVLIVGAGVIGLSLALELSSRGMHVVVAERDTPMAHASSAAAGMLSVEDPHNPNELQALARLSGSLYPAFLNNLQTLSGHAVPFQTSITHQRFRAGAYTLAEHSIDPRQLAPALVSATQSAGVDIRRGLEIPAQETSTHKIAGTGAGHVIFTTGPWPCADLPISPRKGQMLRVRIPAGLELHEVHREEHIYVVPRTRGPQAGTALIGATIEDAGFDTTTSASSLAELRRKGAGLVPALADEALAPLVEAWAGLRPATPDGLPILGELDSQPRPGTRILVATGHFRNGILLAPATAKLMADLIERRTPAIDLQPFSPARFACSPLVA